jgi:hypothetical protein
MVPGLKRVAVLTNPSDPNQASQIEQAQTAAQSLSVELHVAEAATPDKLESAFATIAAARAQALIVLQSASFFYQYPRIVAFTAASRLPALFAEKQVAQAGGLMAYGPSIRACFRRAAAYVDRRAALGNFDLAPGAMDVEAHEQIGGSVALIFAVVALKLARFGRDRASHLADELDRALVEADYWAFRVGRFGIEIEHVLNHPRYRQPARSSRLSVYLVEKSEKRKYSPQLGSHLGNPGLHTIPRDPLNAG